MSNRRARGHGRVGCSLRGGKCRNGAGSSGVAAGQFAFSNFRGWTRRSKFARSRKARNVPLVVWTNNRWFAKAGDHRAGHLGGGSDSSLYSTADQAELYSKLDSAADDELRAIIEANEGVDKDFDEARDLPVPLLRQLITIKLREGNVINQHYKYVDGTSFAAPIVASIVACMLEANPSLTPQQVKRILIETAERVAGVEVERQGWGVVVPRRAVEARRSARCKNDVSADVKSAYAGLSASERLVSRW